MKAALVVLAVVAVAAVCDARRPWTTTMMPCENLCTLEYDPVCAQDPSGTYYLFANPCMLRLCRCRTKIAFTELDNADDCPSDAKKKCPDQLLHSLTEGYGESLEGPGARDSISAQSDSSDSSDEASTRRWDRDDEPRAFF